VRLQLSKSAGNRSLVSPPAGGYTTVRCVVLEPGPPTGVRRISARFSRLGYFGGATMDNTGREIAPRTVEPRSDMLSEGSITHWIAEIKDGKSAGARGIWQRYFPRLVQLACEQIRGVPRGASDEEDVALSALDSFCRAARDGRFPNLADRDGLWRLLLQITVHKAMDLARHERRQRRGGGQTRSLDDLETCLLYTSDAADVYSV